MSEGECGRAHREKGVSGFLCLRHASAINFLLQGPVINCMQFKDVHDTQGLLEICETTGHLGSCSPAGESEQHLEDDPSSRSVASCILSGRVATMLSVC